MNNLNQVFIPIVVLRMPLSKFLNDLLVAGDSGLLSILIILDLTSVFNTISHKILLDKLWSIVGTSLAWSTSYLSGHTQFVHLGQFKSRSTRITTGVPQGLVLGHLLFIIYVLPLGSIFREYGIHFDC